MKSTSLGITSLATAILVSIFSSELALAAELHVGSRLPKGATPSSLFPTLEDARDAIRQFRKSAPLPEEGITVLIQDGDYWPSSTFELGPEDSGEPGSPITYRSAPDKRARFHANTPIDTGQWSPISANARKRLHPKVDATKLVELDLSTLSLKRGQRFAPGKLFSDQWHSIDLFANGKRQPISRWPNSTENIGDRNDPGWITMNGSKSHDSFFYGKGGKPKDDEFHNDLEADKSRRGLRWQSALQNGHDVWLKGLWRTPWQPYTIKVSEINTDEQWIRFSEQPPGGMGSKYTELAGNAPDWRVGSGKENWFALNLLEEIDLPGEWSIDFKDQKLYYYPTAPLADLNLSIADRETPIVRIKQCSNVRLVGLHLDGGMGHGIEIIDGTNNLIAGCEFTNIGNSGIRIQGGSSNTIQSNDIHSGAGWGIELQYLGDLTKLVSSDTTVTNNHIHHIGHLAFREAIRINRCIGVTVTHNLMHDLPKGAVRTDMTNDCTFEYNEVHNIALKESDTGSFYNYGGWTTYGNVWRYNFMHHTNRANGFYSDDGDSGDTFEKNIVQGAINALLMGGGHHNLALNNLFIENKVQSVDDRGISRGYRIDSNYGKRLMEMNPEVEPWKSYGIQLTKKFGYKANLWSDILDPSWKPEYPNGSVMADNISVASGIFLAPQDRGIEVRDNITIPKVSSARFRDYRTMDLRTKNRDILKKFPELNEVFPKIGLMTDSYRQSVPDRAETGGLSNRKNEGDPDDEDQMK